MQVKKMNNLERELTWKYFKEQKTKEVLIILLVITSIAFVPYLIGNLVGDNIDFECSGSHAWDDGIYLGQECTIIEQWGKGLDYILLSILALLTEEVFIILFSVGFISYFFAQMIICWLSDNWKKANYRAKKELKRRKKRR